MSAYFNDPVRVLESELEDVEDEIGKKEKEIRHIDKQIKELEKRKELEEGELEELLAQEKVINKKITKSRLELE
jgi:septal ring factor EnvC (AmiA/AmiB activator)